MLPAYVEQLIKTAANAPVSDEQARRALDSMENLERNKPTAGQLARYSAIGAAAGPTVKSLGRLIESGPKGALGSPRRLAAEAVGGALTTGAVPLARQHLEQHVQKDTLKRYMQEQQMRNKQAMVAFREELLKCASADVLTALPGLMGGYSAGRNIAGETAAALAPEGRVTRSDNIARQAAIVGAPAGGLAGLGLALEHGDAPLKYLKNQRTRQIANLALPFAGAMGGSMLGGLATGAAVGGIQQLRGSPYTEKEAFARAVDLMKLAKGPPMLVTPNMGKLFGQAGQTLKPNAVAQGLVGKPPAGSGGLLAGVAPKARPAGVPTPKMVPGGPAAGPPRPAPGAPLRPVGQVQPPSRAARPMAGSNLFGAVNPNAALAAGAAPFGQAPGTR